MAQKNGSKAGVSISQSKSCSIQGINWRSSSGELWAVAYLSKASYPMSLQLPGKALPSAPIYCRKSGISGEDFFSLVRLCRAKARRFHAAREDNDCYSTAGSTQQL